MLSTTGYLINISMKIGIFGDSFADGRTLEGDLNRYSWATHLARGLGATDIGYHAHGGSPLYWSYQQILEHGHLYDRIILAVTEPMRFPVPVGDERQFATGYPSANEFRNPLRDNLRGWFAVSDQDYLSVVQELFLQDLERRYPGILLIPCFPTSFVAARRQHYGLFYLQSVNKLAQIQMGLDINDYSWMDGYIENTGRNRMLCHIPWTWQDRVAKKILQAMDAARPIPPAETWNLFPENRDYRQYYLRR